MLQQIPSELASHPLAEFDVATGERDSSMETEVPLDF